MDGQHETSLAPQTLKQAHEHVRARPSIASETKIVVGSGEPLLGELAARGRQATAVKVVVE